MPGSVGQTPRRRPQSALGTSEILAAELAWVSGDLSRRPLGLRDLDALRRLSLRLERRLSLLLLFLLRPLEAEPCDSPPGKKGHGNIWAYASFLCPLAFVSSQSFCYPFCLSFFFLSREKFRFGRVNSDVSTSFP